MHSVEIGSKVSAGTIFTSRLVWIDSKLATYQLRCKRIESMHTERQGSECWPSHIMLSRTLMVYVDHGELMTFLWSMPSCGRGRHFPS